MRPCSRNRKPLAWLALGELDARRAAALRAHMETCEGCRRYMEEISGVNDKLAAAKMIPDVQTSEAFHRRVVARLRSERPSAAWQVLAGRFVAGCLNWRTALPVVGGAALVIAMLSVLTRQPAAVPPASIGAQAVLPPDIESDLPPTIANYQRIATRSLDELDELLTKQGKRNPSPIPIYTASLVASARVSD